MDDLAPRIPGLRMTKKGIMTKKTSAHPSLFASAKYTPIKVKTGIITPRVRRQRAIVNTVKTTILKVSL